MSENGTTILVYSGYPEDDRILERSILEEFPGVTVLVAESDEDLASKLPGADVLYAWSFPVHLLEYARRLRWFQVMGAGVDRIASGPPLPETVTVTNIKNVFGGLMSEYAFAYMFAHAQQIRRTMRAQSERRWDRFDPGRLGGQTLGVIGLGSIGREVVNKGVAMGMRVLGVRRSGGEVEGCKKVYAVAQIDEFLPQCDFLVCVIPHTPETVGLLTLDRLRSLPRHCFLVNMGRGTLYREEDMVEALREGWIAGAALDVFPTEPLPESSPLWGLENVFITPHISGTNRPAEIVRPFLQNLERYLAGEELLYQVDLSRGY